MFVYCALVGEIKDSVSQNARCNSEKNLKHSENFFTLYR
jgi:hypothetical protein